MSEQELTIKDVLVAMTSMESRLRAEIQESAKTIQSELREEIQESSATALEAVQSLASHMDQQFAKTHAMMATKDFVERRIAQV